MPQPLGRDARLYMLAQAAAGVAATGNYVPAPFYALTPRRDEALEDDPILGVGLHNPIDAQPPAPGLVEAGLDIAAPLCINHIGLLLPHLLSAAAPSGSGPYDHVFTSGQRELAGCSLAWTDAGSWRRANTWVASRLEIPIGQEAGFRQIRMSGMAVDIEALESDPTGTPPAMMALKQVPGAVCSILKDGAAVARVLSGSITIDRPIVADRFVHGSRRTASGFTPDAGLSVTASLEMRLIDNTFRDFARAAHSAAGVDDFTLEWALGADEKLTFVLPAARFTPAERSVEGVGLRTERYELRAEQTANAPALTATLRTSIASYPVEAA